jgi:hypothetical protein
MALGAAVVHYWLEDLDGAAIQSSAPGQPADPQTSRFRADDRDVVAAFERLGLTLAGR